VSFVCDVFALNIFINNIFSDLALQHRGSKLMSTRL